MYMYNCHQSRLKRMQKWAVRFAFSFKKYDHVSDYYKRLHWLPLDQFIKFCFVCSMYKQFHQGRCIPLEPPIQLGQSHSHPPILVILHWYSLIVQSLTG